MTEPIPSPFRAGLPAKLLMLILFSVPWSMNSSIVQAATAPGHSLSPPIASLDRLRDQMSLEPGFMFITFLGLLVLTAVCLWLWRREIVSLFLTRDKSGKIYFNGRILPVIIILGILSVIMTYPLAFRDRKSVV